MSEEKKRRKRRGERSNGLIQVSLQIGRKEDGSPLRKYFYGKTRAEAERKRQKFAETINKDSTIDPNITVRKWVDIYLDTYRTNVNEAYRDADAIPYKRLARALGSRRMVDIREADLQLELNELAGTSFSNVDKYRQSMKRLFERARRNKIITENPAEYLTRYADRAPVIHLKDCVKEGGRSGFCPVGMGVLDFDSILAVCDRADWVCVEQDLPSMGLDAFGCAEASVKYLLAAES